MASLGQVVKTYGTSSPQPGMNPQSAASRYSPGRLLSIEKTAAIGAPDMKHVSTSFMERWNLTLRMQNRRFTRLTNGFSKKFENHCHMLAMTMVYYNFCRKHASLKGQTPAMAALDGCRYALAGHVVRSGGRVMLQTTRQTRPLPNRPAFLDPVKTPGLTNV